MKNKNMFINFDDISGIDSEVTSLIKESNTKQRTHRLVHRLFNMKDLASAEEAESGQMTDVTNHGHGYHVANMMRSQLYSIYTQTKTPVDFEFDNELKDQIENWNEIEAFAKGEIKTSINKEIVKSRRWEKVWRSVSKQLPLYGKVQLVFPNKDDWCPEVRRLLIPANTGLLASDVPYAISIGKMSISELRKKSTLVSHLWNKEAIDSAIESIRLASKTGGISSSHQGVEYGAETELDREEMQEESDYGFSRVDIPVYYVYEVDHTKEDMPVSMSIVTKLSDSYIKSCKEKNNLPARVIYHNPKEYNRVDEWYHPVYMDCSLETSEKYNSVKGYGELIYNSVIDLEETQNEIKAGAREWSRLKYTVRDGSDIELLRRYAGTNLIPEGLSIAQMGTTPNFQGLQPVIAGLKENIAMNAGGLVTNSSSGSEELRFQAQQRSSVSEQVLQTHLNDIYNSLDGVKNEMARRFFYTTNLGAKNKGAKQIKRFRRAMDKKKIPYKKIGFAYDGDFDYLTVKATRSATNGSFFKEQRVNQYLASTMELRSEEQKNEVLHYLDDLNLENHDLVEKFSGKREELPVDHINRANGENAAMMMNAPTGYVSPLSSDDIDSIHVPIHFQRQEALLLIGEKEGWKVEHAQEFQLNQQHSFLHIDRIKKRGDKQLAQQMDNEASQFQRRAGEYVNNLQAEQNSQDVSLQDDFKNRLEMEKMQLKQAQEQRLADGHEFNKQIKSQKLQADIAAQQERNNQGADKVAANRAIAIDKIKQNNQNEVNNGSNTTT